MNNYIIYDYLTFTSKIHNQLSILDLLGLHEVKFENLKGFYGYQDRLYYDGISIHYNGRSDMGVCVELSGHGCRAFEKYGNGNYDLIFSEILDNYSENADKRQMNITRIDIAYDDFAGILDLDLLSSETVKQNFVSRFKDWQVIQGNKGAAVNHGSNKSNVYIRCYDKRLEQNVLDQVEHWVRLEIQIRKECALGFIRLGDQIEDKYFYVLNQYLRYIDSSDDSNKSRCQTAEHWKRFIENEECRSIFHKPADNYSFDKLYTFVNSQLPGCINTYIDVVGVPQFLHDIYNSAKGKKLNPKYVSIKAESNSSGSGILKYLAEHGL